MIQCTCHQYATQYSTDRTMSMSHAMSKSVHTSQRQTYKDIQSLCQTHNVDTSTSQLRCREGARLWGACTGCQAVHRVVGQSAGLPPHMPPPLPLPSSQVVHSITLLLCCQFINDSHGSSTQVPLCPCLQSVAPRVQTGVLCV